MIAGSVELHIDYLVSEAQSGSVEAFEELYKSYCSTVFHLANQMLNDRDVAQEVTQDTFVKAYKSLSTYNPRRGTFKGWLARIAINTCHNKRRRPILSWISLEHQQSIGLEPPTNNPSPIEQLLSDEKELEIWHAIQQLSPKLRIVVILRYYQDFTYDDIAVALNCSKGAIASRLHEAHTKLRKQLGGIIDEYPIG